MGAQVGIVERVQEILEKSGLSKTDFANAIGIDGPKLAKSLGGKRRFSSLELALIADLGDVSVDWIVTGQVPLNLVLAHRSVASAQDAADEIASATITLLHERAEGLTKLGRPLEVPEFPEPPVVGGWLKKATVLASKVTEMLGASVGGLSNSELFELVENKLGVHVVVEHLPDGCDGASYSDGAFRGVVLAATESAFRQRFTLGHELGHIAFGHSNEAFIEETIGREKTTSEKIADTFAASLLAPSQEIRNFLGERTAQDTFDELVLHFQLSPVSMSWKLLNEGLLEEASRQPLGALSARSVAMRCGRAAELAETSRQSAVRRSASRLVNAYLNAYESGASTLRPAAALLGISIEETESFFYGPSADDLVGTTEG